MAQKKTSPLLSAYLVVGEDALKRRTVLERLRKRLFPDGESDFDHETFSGENAQGADIVASCNTLPFMSEHRLVEVTNADKLPKASSEALIAYLDSPNERTILALSADKLAKTTRLYKAVAALGKTAVIDCTPLKRYELVKAVRQMAVGYGFTMEQDACETLVELVGENTVHIDSELAKIAVSHSGVKAVTSSDVEQLVSRTTEPKPWQLVDAFSKRDLRECMRMLDIIESSSPYVLIAQTSTRIRELICAKTLSERGEAQLLPDVLGVPAWRVKNHAQWSRNYSSDELRNALSTARDCERAMKSGTDPDTAFREWLIKTVARTS